MPRRRLLFLAGDFNTAPVRSGPRWLQGPAVPASADAYNPEALLLDHQLVRLSDRLSLPLERPDADTATRVDVRAEGCPAETHARAAGKPACHRLSAAHAEPLSVKPMTGLLTVRGG